MSQARTASWQTSAGGRSAAGKNCMSLAERPARRAASLAAWTKLRPSGTRAIRLVWLRKIVRALMGNRRLGSQGLSPPPLYACGGKLLTCRLDLVRHVNNLPPPFCPRPIPKNEETMMNRREFLGTAGAVALV